MAATSLPDYFDAFPDFNPDPHNSLLLEFNRLATLRCWKNRRYERERRNCMTSQFDKYLRDFVECSAGREASGGSGDDYHELDTWQNLCAELGVKAIPPSIAQCKKTLRSEVHVNIIDLIDSRRMRTQVRTFPTFRQLQQYTLQSGKYFPRAKAKENVLLKILLRTF